MAASFRYLELRSGRCSEVALLYTRHAVFVAVPHHIKFVYSLWRHRIRLLYNL